MSARTASSGSIAPVGHIGYMKLEARLELTACRGSFRRPCRLKTFYKLQFLHINRHSGSCCRLPFCQLGAQLFEGRVRGNARHSSVSSSGSSTLLNDRQRWCRAVGNDPFFTRSLAARSSTESTRRFTRRSFI